jgi:hypothetical protein
MMRVKLNEWYNNVQCGSKVIETVRPNGILIAQITPRGGRISGTSSLFNWMLELGRGFS